MAPKVNEDTPSYEEVFISRSQIRAEIGARGICIEVRTPNQNKEKWRLERFIDEDGDFIDVLVAKMVNDWNIKAREAPRRKRNCLMCNRRTIRGLTLCGHCDPQWHDIIYA